jgi:hypothetical protein
MGRKAKLAGRALKIVSRLDEPDHWAALMYAKASFLARSIEPKRAGNLEEAIACFRRALEVMTREAMPVESVAKTPGAGLLG